MHPGGRELFLSAVLVLAGIGAARAADFDVLNLETSAYVINGEINPTLTVTRGTTYTFSINASGHPFFIKTVASIGTGDAYNVGVTNNGTDVGTITWTVDPSAPATLFYACEFHEEMEGQVNVIDQPTATPTPTPAATDTVTNGPSPTPTSTPIDTSTATMTPSPVATATPPPSATPSPTPPHGCPAAPAASCLDSEKATFTLKINSTAAKDKLLWKWGDGDAVNNADLGDPTASTDYSLCVYGNANLLLAATAPHGALWTATGGSPPKGYKYADKLGSSDGITKAQTGIGGAGKSKAQVKGKGANLPVVTLPLLPDQFPVTVQLRNTATSQCWTDQFPMAAVKNDTKELLLKRP